MTYRGTIIKESLKSYSFEHLLTVTNIETWDIDNATEDQPKIWTVVMFENSDDNFQRVKR